MSNTREKHKSSELRNASGPVDLALMPSGKEVEEPACLPRATSPVHDDREEHREMHSETASLYPMASSGFSLSLLLR